MKTLPLSDVKANLSELVDSVDRRDESITITRNGKAVAVIVSTNEYDGWRETAEILRDRDLMKEIRAGMRDLRKSRKRFTLDELFGG
jgi:prevent-host-death family protein